ncbi:methionine adenosyltransferase [Hydrogenobaculum acidophilum]
MDFIVVSEMTFEKVSTQEAEIVERKGIGHPDTICDSLAEELSVELSKMYIRELGAIMHHNVDKALLVGGKAQAKFGGGEVISPIEIFLVGRALRDINGKEFPVDELAIDVAHNWLKKHIRNLDFSKHIILQTRIKPGSKDLVELFDRFQTKGEVPLSNDTSFGVGFAPFSELENIVFHTEKLLNSDELKKEHPEVGEDIKVMGVRIKDNIRITVSAAFVDKYVKDIKQYKEQKEAVTNKVLENARKYTNKNVSVFVNTADDIENESVYITVTGTSSEQGDDGQVGRGNRANGLITPYRPMSLEAAAGKNPVSHIGKIYNVVANTIAKRVVEEVEGIEEAYCYMVSQIGKPINRPQVCDVKVRRSSGTYDKEAVKRIAEEELENMPNTWKLFLEKRFSVA